MKDKVKQILAPFKGDIKAILSKNIWWVLLFSLGIIVMVGAVVVAFMPIVLADKYDVSIMITYIGMAIMIVGALMFVIGFQMWKRRWRSGERHDFFADKLDLSTKLYEAYLEDEKSSLKLEKVDYYLDENRHHRNALFLQDDKARYVWSTETWITNSGRNSGGVIAASVTIDVTSAFLGGSAGGSYGRNQTYYTTFKLKKVPLASITLSEIEIAEIKTDSLGNHNSTFESESMDFNKMFNIMGPENLLITKMFNPKVIVDMVKIGAKPYKKHRTHLFENYGTTAITKTKMNGRPYWGLTEFNMSAFNYNQFVRMLCKKIESDYEMFFDNKQLLDPFNFA